jgi:PAS domain S-box-containing protein
MTAGAIRPRLNPQRIPLVKVALPFEKSVWLTAALVSLGYFVGAKIGFALTFQPHPISTLWPPSSILLAALVVTKPRYWWLLLAAAFPAHLAAQVQGGVPFIQIAAWFVSNCSQALIGAGAICLLAGCPLRFESFRDVCIFIAFGALIAPFIASFIDVAFVTAIGWVQGSYATLWRLRFFSNVLTALTFVPVIVTCVSLGPQVLRSASVRQYVEAAALFLGLLIVSYLVFVGSSLRGNVEPALIYAPVPFLIWAAIRLGPLGTSASLLTVALFAVWGTIHGQGPFVTASAAESVLSTQLFLIMLSSTLLLLSSVVEQNRKTAKALQQSEEQLRLAIGAAKIGTWDWSIPKNTASRSTDAKRMSGSPSAHVAPMLEHFGELLHPDDHDAVQQAVTRAIEGKLPFEVEFRVVRPNEPTRWVLGKGEALYDASGKADRMVGVNVDITDRKRSEEILLGVNENLRHEIADRARVEEALRNSEERFAKAFHSGPDAICITKLVDARLIDVNDRWQLLFGFRRVHVLGRTLAELGIVRNAADQARLDDLASAQSQQHTTELSLKASSGDLLEAIVTAENTEMSGEPCRISVIRDVTEQRRTERESQNQRQQMAHLMRVALLGQLSGALAHELNQPLTAILSNAQAAQRFLKGDAVDLAEMRAILDDIVEDDKRAGEVIQRLRSLLKRGEAQLQKINMNDVVAETLKLSHGDLIARHVVVATTFAHGIACVRGDRVQLQQVFLNLIINAADAMAAVAPEERRITIVTKNSGDQVRVSVVDQGHGIPAEQMSRLFEPFFTTKEQGLGLGLSISRSIIAAHSGRLWAENNLDRGVTIHLTLPAWG